MNVTIPFFTAAEKGYVNIIKLFLDMKIVDINIMDNMKETALMKAAFNGHVRLVDYLLKQPKINVKLWNVEGLTALDLAQRNGNVDVITLLKQHIKQLINSNEYSVNTVKFKNYRSSSENIDLSYIHDLIKRSSELNLSSPDLSAQL